MDLLNVCLKIILSSHVRISFKQTYILVQYLSLVKKSYMGCVYGLYGTIYGILGAIYG